MTIMTGGTPSQGTPIGILIADTTSPHIIGDVGNGFTYDFPVRFATVKGATPQRIAKRDASLLAPCLEAARGLEADGCQAVACGCNAFSIFYKQLSRNIKIPVLASSLIQAAFAAQIIQPNQTIGILTDDATQLGTSECAGYGLTEDRIVIQGMETSSAFYPAFRGGRDCFDYEAVEADIRDAVEELLQKSPYIGAIICEGTSFTPFSPMINRLAGVPVFDLVTLIHLVASGLLRGLTSPFKNRRNGGVTSGPPPWGKSSRQRDGMIL